MPFSFLLLTEGQVDRTVTVLIFKVRMAGPGVSVMRTTEQESGLPGPYDKPRQFEAQLLFLEPAKLF